RGRRGRDGYVAHALVVLLVVARVAPFADLVEGASQDCSVRDRPGRVPAQIQALEQRVPPNGRQVGEECLPRAGCMERRAVSDRSEKTHDLGRWHGLDVDRLELVEHDEVRGLSRRLGEPTEERTRAKAQLAEARA